MSAGSSWTSGKSPIVTPWFFHPLRRTPRTQQKHSREKQEGRREEDVDGVLHEFSSVEGVREDVTDIILAPAGTISRALLNREDVRKRFNRIVLVDNFILPVNRVSSFFNQGIKILIKYS